MKEKKSLKQFKFRTLPALEIFYLLYQLRVSEDSNCSLNLLSNKTTFTQNILG